MIEWMKKNRKELLLPFLCFVLGLLLAIASIQVQEQETDTKEDQTLTRFQPKDYKNLVSKEQEIKQFKWTIEAVANLKVRLKQSQQPGTRLETIVTEWGKAQKVKYTKTAQGDKSVLVLTYAAKQTDQGKKSVTLWFEQEKDQGYRLMMVDATNLQNAKEKTSSEKEITTEKEKKEIIAKILEGDQKAKDKWYVIERNLQELMDNGNVEAEKELAKWDDLLYEAGL